MDCTSCNSNAGTTYGLDLSAFASSAKGAHVGRKRWRGSLYRQITFVEKILRCSNWKQIINKREESTNQFKNENSNSTPGQLLFRPFWGSSAGGREENLTLSTAVDLPRREKRRLCAARVSAQPSPPRSVCAISGRGAAIFPPAQNRPHFSTGQPGALNTKVMALSVNTADNFAGISRIKLKCASHDSKSKCRDFEKKGGDRGWSEK